MPWKESSKTMLRNDFTDAVLSGKMTMSRACREFGISRPTGYKWIARAQNGEQMDDRSRAPHTVANRIAPEVEAKIVEYRRQYSTIGAVKMHRMLENDNFAPLPCASTINAVFKRNGLITKEASLAATPYKRFEKCEPNEMWQADYKGAFSLKNGERCHPLNILDDCTRFNLCCDAKTDETFLSAHESIERIFREYGLPRIFLCDNGNPWGVAQTSGITRLEVWFMDLGVLTIHGRSWHPQTQGKEERFNGTLKRELLSMVEMADIEEAQRLFQEFRSFYNFRRPHHALGLDTPGSRYSASERRYPEKIEEWEYPSGYELRKVKDSGYFNFGGKTYFLSEAMAGKTIAIRESSQPGCVSIHYRQFKLARLSVDQQAFVFKRIYLAEGDPRLAPTLG